MSDAVHDPFVEIKERVRRRFGGCYLPLADRARAEGIAEQKIREVLQDELELDDALPRMPAWARAHVARELTTELLARHPRSP